MTIPAVSQAWLLGRRRRGLNYRQLAKALSASAVYPLDLAGALPAFAYGTKKLTATYNGPAFRLVRPSDSATLDVGFVGQDWDTALVDAFLGTQIGHLDKYYNQLGDGKDSTQITDASRPLIEPASASGGPVVVNGKRPVIFNTASMALPAGLSSSRSSFATYSVLEPFGANLSAIVQLGSSTNQMTQFQQSFDLWGNGVPNLGKPIEDGRVALFVATGNGTAATNQQDLESASGATSAVTMAGGFIGNTGLSAGYDGKFYSLAHIGYSRSPSVAEDSALKTALRRLFGLVTVANSGRVIWVGDSITGATAGASYSYGFAKMAQRSLGQNVACYSVAAGGSQIQNMLASYATNGAGYILQKYTDTRIVFMLYGTNDLTIGARTAAQIYADIQTYAGKVRTDGGKIIVCSLTPNNGWTTAQKTTRTDLGALLRANWASFADGFCDFENNATMGPQAAAANTSLYFDGLHPTRLGHTYLAVDALAAIRAAGLN